MNSFVKSLLNVIPSGLSTPSCKINIGEVCIGVTAGKDKIYIGGEDKVIILNIDGSFVREISTDRGDNNNLLYNERNDQLLLRQNKSTYVYMTLLIHSQSSVS
jgi:hypothetical protein